MVTIIFTARPYVVNGRTIIHLPMVDSQKLPSRNIAAVKGTLNGSTFQTVLEPDGKGSHWFELGEELQKVTGNDSVQVTLETDNWPEPTIPTDLRHALDADTKAHETWLKTTPMARWEWIRWIRATSVAETRQKRIEVSCSKLRKGMRRPCCFNTSMCTVPEVSKGGVLLVPPHQ